MIRYLDDKVADYAADRGVYYGSNGPALADEIQRALGSGGSNG